MPNEYPRYRRVAEQLKRELSMLIATEVKDPRAALAVITDVVVSRDLAKAKVYVGAADLSDDAGAMVRGLTHAAGFLRKRLADVLRMRGVPVLQFIEDASEREAFKLDRLIEAAVREDRSRHDTAPDDGGEDSHGP